jgi:hypothetical protein
MQVPLTGGQQGIFDRGAEAAFGMMVFSYYDASRSHLRRCHQRLGVDRLDRVQIDDPRRDALATQNRRRLQALVQGHTCTDQCHLIGAAGLEHFRPADGKLLSSRVQPGVTAAGGAHVADPRPSSHLRHQRSGARAVARVQRRRPVYGAHHRQVFQPHLGQPVFTDLHP